MSLQAIRQSALNLLARRDHTKQELMQKLSTKGHSKEDITEVINALDQKKLINEDRFTESYVRMRRNKGYGPDRIRQELNARGITDITIAEHLMLADNGWSKVARDVWQKHFKGKQPDSYAEQAKQMRFLQYRGFNREHIRSLFKDEEM